MSHYNGFSYEEFYEFIVDFFEADATPAVQKASAKLLEWWNECVLSFIFAPPSLTQTPLQNGVSEISSHTCSCIGVSRTSVVRDPATTTPGCSFISPAIIVSCSAPSFRLSCINITVFRESLVSNV